MPGPSYLASYGLSGGKPPAVPDEGQIASLFDMSFPRFACETALARTHHNLNLATKFLLASPVLVQRAQDEEVAAAAAVAAPHPQLPGNNPHQLKSHPPRRKPLKP